MAIDFELNAKPVSVDVDPQTPLLEVLRNDIELNGPKFGCGLAQCGACAVLLDGVSIRSCVLPVQSGRGQARHNARRPWYRDVSARVTDGIH